MNNQPHQISFWEKSSLLEFEYLILGAGLTGLYTALEIKSKNPLAKIAILEKGPFSMGASTRNAGFACFGIFSEILDDLKNDSIDAVYGLMAKRFHGLERTKKILGEKNIGFEYAGSNELFNSKNNEDKIPAFEYVNEANKLMKEFTNLEKVFNINTVNHFDFRDFAGAISNPYEGQLHTGKLYKTLWEKVVSLKVMIYGGIEVSGWESSNNQIKVNTSKGIEFKASKLLICNNAFASQFFPEMDIVPARGQVLVTEPIPNLHIHGIFHYDKGYYYWRNIDNRILLGGARNKDKETENTLISSTNQTIQDKLIRFLKEDILAGKYPELKIEYQWSGIMGMGTQKKPIIEKIGENIWLAVRLGGMGVALSSVIGKELTELVFAD